MDEEDGNGFSRGEAYGGEADPRLAWARTGQASCTIDQLAREFGITPRALRFYEQKGLLTPQRRGGVRQYGPDERELLAQLLKAKSLGFTLAEIRKMVVRTVETGAPSLDIRRAQCLGQIRHLEARKREIEAALAELRRTYSSFYVRLMQQMPPGS